MTASSTGFTCVLDARASLAECPLWSADEQALTFPGLLQGVAADGVAKVAFLDAGGRVLDSTSVVDNLFASDTRLDLGVAAYLETLDANGNVTSRRPLP